MLNVSRLRVLREVAQPRLVLGRGGVALLHPVGRLAADRGARGGDGTGVAGTPTPRGAPDRRRTHAGGAHRWDPRPPGGRRGGARRAGGPARGTAADGVVPDRGRDADAGGDRRVPRILPRGGADARRGRARGDRAAPARGRVRSRAAVRVRREPRRASSGWSCWRIRCTSRSPAATGWRASARYAWRSCAARRGCKPRRPAPARATWCAAATRRGSSRTWRSRATTTRRCKGWWRRASGSR